MNVQIKTAFGEMSFDMTKENALKLIDQAISYANGNTNSEPAPVDRPVAYGSNMVAPVKAEEKPEPRSRIDNVEARGFLFVKCEACGKVKGFLSRHTLTYYQCECGHKTELHGLRFAHVDCKCGKKYTYITNLQDDFTIDCLNCGSPVDMEMGAKGTAFVTVGQKYAGGVLASGKPYVFRQSHRYL